MNNMVLNSDEKNSNVKCFSKKCVTFIVVVLVCSLIIFFSKFITSMDWYWRYQVESLLSHDDALKEALDIIPSLIEVTNWIIVLLITIVSSIFLFLEKKEGYITDLYIWYIVAGLLHIFMGTVGLTPLIYGLSTLIILIKLKKDDDHSKLVLFSKLVLAIIIFMFIGIQTGLFDKMKTFVKEVEKNSETLIKDEDDDKYLITSFNNLIEDWGDDISKNKSYKIKNVKLQNITASLYIDYIVNNNSGKNLGELVIKHGENQIYSYKDNYASFNLAYIGQYKDLIIMGINYCDEINNGMCDNHLTYSKVIVFNSLDLITIYDSSVIGNYNGIELYNYSSVFSKSIMYAEPYNDFRIYDIKIKNNNVYFKMIVENYDQVFEDDYIKYDNNCDNQFWVASNFDMQREYSVNFIYNDSVGEYGVYDVGDIIKTDNVTYNDYCFNKNVLKINR